MVQITKPLSDENLNIQPDQIKIYINSKLQRLDFNAAELFEQILISLKSFASHGSGWTVELARCQYLLNIRDQSDEKCFLYCFTDQYHKTFGPPIVNRKCAMEAINKTHYVQSQKPGSQTTSRRISNANVFSPI